MQAYDLLSEQRRECHQAVDIHIAHLLHCQSEACATHKFSKSAKLKLHLIRVLAKARQFVLTNE